MTVSQRIQLVLKGSRAADCAVDLVEVGASRIFRNG